MNYSVHVANKWFTCHRGEPSTSHMPASIAAAELADRQRLQAVALFVRAGTREVPPNAILRQVERGSRDREVDRVMVMAILTPRAAVTQFPSDVSALVYVLTLRAAVTHFPPGGHLRAPSCGTNGEREGRGTVKRTGWWWEFVDW